MGWLKKLFKNKFAIGAIILVVVSGGYFGYKNLRNNQEPIRYETAGVVKGIFIASVSGSGQVSASDQIDLQAKVSGDVVYVGVKKDQEVKAGMLLFEIDARDARRAVSDAEIALEGAKIKLEELLSPPDAAQSLLGAENALAQAERDLEKAEQTYETIEQDTASALASAYEDGYSDVSTSFFKLSDYMKDLKDVLGTEKSEQEHITSYKNILGQDSPLIQKFIDDYYRANNFYNKNFTFFREVFRDDDRDTVYQLIEDTLETTKAISQALESARHMYDALVAGSYTKYLISTTIDKMQPKIESDLSSVFSTITSLQKTIDTIDNTLRDAPDKIKDAKLALDSARERLEEKRQSLEKLKAGADPFDIRTQQNIVAQKGAALIEAKEKLADCFIRAPFDGVIAKINVKKGDSASSGTALATLITKQRMAEITLNEIDIAKIKVGQKVTITFDAVTDFSITGEVAEVETLGAVTQGVVTYNVKIGFDTQDERVKPGMSVSAAIITEMKADALLVPNSAVKTQEELGSYVEILENGNPKALPIQVGEANDTVTEVEGDIKPGEEVITQTIQPNQSQTSASTNQRQTGGLPGFGGVFRVEGR